MKYVFSITVFFLLSACDFSVPDYTGEWVEKNNETNHLSIKLNEDQYAVTIGERAYEATTRGKKLKVNIQPPKSIYFNENMELMMGEITFIKYEHSNQYIIDQETVKGGGASFCLLKDIYEKNGNIFVIVDNTELDKENQDQDTYVFKNERVDTRIYLLPKEAHILTSANKILEFDFAQRQELIDYKMWHIVVEAGVVKKLSQVDSQDSNLSL